MPAKDRPVEVTPAVLLAEVWSLPAPPAVWITAGSATGKEIARLVGPSGPVCLRRYPAGTSPQWLAALHQAVSYLERQGFELFPHFQESEQGETLVRHTGRWCDLTPWIDDPALPPDQLSPSQLSNLGAAVARLHQAGQGAPGPAVRFDWLAGPLLRTQQLAWDPVARGKDPWQPLENVSGYFRSVDLASVPERSAEEVAAIVAAAIAAIHWLEPEGSIATLAAEAPTLTHGDLWPDHVRFAGDEVSAVLDLDTLALRPPLGDLAALCGDFGEWDRDRCQAILAGYHQHREINPECLPEIPRLGALRALGVLRAHLRDWLDPNRPPGRSQRLLAGPVPYWRDQLRRLATTDSREFGKS